MKKGLGRGFETLIPTDLIGGDFDPTAPEDAKVSQLTEIEVDVIVYDESQPRQKFDAVALKELADSIKEHGVLQPIVVTPIEGKKDQYQVVAGERRLRAAKDIGLKKIPAIVRSLSAQNRLELSIIENAQREDLTAIELATAYAKLKTQFNLSDDEIAKRVGKSKIGVINTMRLLNLPDFAKKAMLEHHLTEGVMRPLIKADPELIKEVLPKIVKEGWSARKVEQYLNAKKAKSSLRKTKISLYARDERDLSKKYNAEVFIRGHSVRFACKTDAELKALLKILGE